MTSKEFSMRQRVKLLAVGETHVFVRIIYPKVWGFNDYETTLRLDVFTKQYKEES